MGKFVLDSGDPEVDSMMGDIRRDFGEAAAEGRPTSKFTLDEEPKFVLDEPAPHTDRSVTSWRQGGKPAPARPLVKATTPKDFKLPPGYTSEKGELTKTDDKPGLLERGAHALVENPVVGAIAHGVSRLGEQYEERIAKPYRQLMFKEDPLEVQAKRVQEAESYEDIAWEVTKQILLGIGTDPLTGIGSGFGGSRLAAPNLSTKTPIWTGDRTFGHTPHRATVIEPPVAGGHVGPEMEGGIPILKGPVPEQPLWESKIPGANPVQVPDQPLGPGPWRGKLSEQYSPSDEMRLRLLDVYGHTLPEASDTALRPYGNKYIPQEPGKGLLPKAQDFSSAPSSRVPGEVVPEPMGTVLLPKREQVDPLAITPREHKSVTKGWEDQTRLPKVVTKDTPLTDAQKAQFEIDWKASRDKRYQELGEFGKLDSMTAEGLMPEYGPRGKGLYTASPAAGAKLAGTIHSELESTGPIGQEIAHLDRVDIIAKSEQLAYGDITAMDDMFEKHFGLAPIWKRINPFALPDHTTFYNITKDQVRQLVNYMYTASGDYGKVWIPKDPKVRAFADELIQYNNEHSSMHPGVRQAMVLNADGSKTPVGSPKAYYPHNPVSPELQEGLSGKAYEMAFKQRQKVEPNLTRTEFSRRLAEYKDKYPRYAGLEMARLLDATDGGTKEPFQVLKDLGYGVDPLKDFSMRYVGMYRRGQQILAEPRMKQLLDDLHNEYAGSPKDQQWVKQVSERIMGLDREFPDRLFNDFVTKANNLTNAMLLQRSAVQQYNQLTYVMSRYGAGNLAKAIFKLPDEVQKEVMAKSAANLATYLQMLTPNPDAFGQILQRELQVNMMTRSDSALRLLAARASDMDLMQYMKRYGGNVEHPAFVARLKEARFSPRQIADIQKNGLTMADRIQAAKISADETQGRPGYQGIPSWAASAQGPLGRAMLNLKRFQLANMTEVRRQTTEALQKGVPMSTVLKRVAMGVGGAEVLGEITNDAAYVLLNFESPLQDERTPQWMRKMMGPTTGRAVQNLVAGVGSYQAALTMAIIQGTDDALSNLFTPVAGAKAWDIYQEVRKSVEKGDTDALLRFVLKHTIGTTGPMGPKPQPNEGMGLPRTPGMNQGE